MDGLPALAPELPDELLLAELLPEELLLDELLLDELLLDELLLDELLGELGDGREALGGEGMLGVVGVLALGQPLSRAHSPAAPRARASGFLVPSVLPVVDVIGYHQSGCFHRHSIRDARPEGRLAQAAHDVIGLVVKGGIFIQPVQIHDLAAGAHSEF